MAEYSGPVTVIDARVACLKPDPSTTRLKFFYSTLHSLDSVHSGVTPPKYGNFFGSYPWPLISGFVTASPEPMTRVPRLNGTAGVDFNCSFATPYPEVAGGGGWPMTICASFNSSKTKRARLVLNIEPYSQDPHSREAQHFDGGNTPVQDGVYLVINTTGTMRDWRNLSDYQPIFGRWTDLKPTESQSQSEWLHLSAGTLSLGFSVSLCYTAPVTMNAFVNAIADGNKLRTRPSLGHCPPEI
ncbi:hypothetical protein B0T14DRAFT_568256 [Immersiella caudata]|uniref:Uncharacterized protein n=1 Tax=Immersiella caudata TaxID=314043 RepID=A0AA40BWY0_9PEZI|nr:hypothetical protein B0T14DRAFT_568256 [Immersiella caudata]